MKVSCIVKLDKMKIQSKTTKSKKRAIQATAIEFARLADEYVPFLTGTMSKSVSRSAFDRGEITYDTPYAKAVYNRDNNSTNWTRDHHPKAMSKWGDFVKAKYRSHLEKVFQKVLNEG